MIKQIQKTPEKAVFITDMGVSLANAIRRSINEISILAIDEVDIYKNDSVLYDEILAHRLGLIPLKNEKLTEFEDCSCKGKGCTKCTLQLKLSVKGDKENTEVLSGEFGKDVVYEGIPITYLEKDQELEVVAKARSGKGKKHAKYLPGLIYYHNLHKVAISGEGEKHSELAELYPKIFEFDVKLKVKNEFECDLDQEDFKDFKGITIKPTEEVVFYIESWGQIKAEEIFLDSIKAVESNLKELEKAVK